MRPRGTTDPSRRQPQPRVLQLEHREWVALRGPGTEVAVLVVAGGHRDVELARPRQQLTAGGDDDRRVEAEPIGVPVLGALVERCVHMDTGLGGEPCRELIRGPTGEILGLGAGALRPSRVHGEVAAQGQLLQTHELGTLLGRTVDPGGERRFVLGRVGMPALLYEPDPEVAATCGALARERDLGAGGGDQVAAHEPTLGAAGEPRSGTLRGVRTDAHARRDHPLMANIAFSIGAGLGSLLITVLAATQGLIAVAVIWGLLAVAFAARAELGRRRRR